MQANVDTAREWFSRAANQGLAAAQFNLAMLHLGNEDDPQSEALAVKWLTMAAEQNHRECSTAARQKYIFRTLTTRCELNVSAQLMRELADTGDEEAQMQLGLMYTFGHGRRARTGGGTILVAGGSIAGIHERRKLISPALYAQGIGTVPDAVRAYAWLTVSAEHSNEAKHAARRSHC